MKILVTALALLLYSFTLNAQDTTQKVVSGRHNSVEQQHKTYVILISIDGFRWDLADKYQARNLQALREKGVQTTYLRPSYPSLTFPNHYSIVTGLYPSHHGIVDNTFYDKKRNVIYRKSDPKVALDSSWYGGKPLWVLAEEQQLLSAIFYWPGSEISMNGIKPTYFYNYNEIIPVERRIAIVRNWLGLPDERRPHFIALYFPQVDKASHSNAVDSEQTEAAVKIVDEAVGKLVAVAEASGLPVNFIVVSDHGMTTIDRVNTIKMPQAVSLEEFRVPNGNALLHLYAKDPKFIKPTYKALKKEAVDFNVYLTKHTPRDWHYGKRDDYYNRIGDMILVPRLPKVFNINNATPDIGQHGFDPAIPDMRATFYAWGPQFKEGYKLEAFDNVHIYPLVAKILGLKISNKIDGKIKPLKAVLK